MRVLMGREEGWRGVTEVASLDGTQSHADWQEQRFQTAPGACPPGWSNYNRLMATINEVEKLAFDLPEAQRAVLAVHLLQSLPPVLQDDDEGLAEALRRDAELDAHPEMGISMVQLDQQVVRRRT